MWLFAFALTFLFALLSVFYIASKLYAFPVFQKLAPKRKRLARFLSILCTAALSAAAIILTGLVNGLVIILHLMVFLMLCGIVRRVVRKLLKRELSAVMSVCCAFAITAFYLVFGWYNAVHVRQTEYNFSTDKTNEHLRIVQFSDAHIGTTFDADGFAALLERISEQQPDVVVITGDLVDDSTSREDMLAGCKALSVLKPKYGVYYVYGNHDKGYYSDYVRGWTEDELADALEENGVNILEDTTVLIGDNIRIIGRKDASEETRGGSRLSPGELIGNDSDSCYNIVLDHQPREYLSEAEAGADLVLSGHTHGGQLIPINRIGEWIGVNDSTYGLSTIDSTNFIVSSGIGDWALWFKTGCFSEYVVIDIN